MYQCPFVPTDPNLNVKTLMSLLSTVSVDTLKPCLLIPFSKSREIQQKIKTEGDQRQTLIQWYLDCSPFADFTDLAGRLYFLKETSALDQVKRYALTVPGMSYVCISSVCVKVFNDWQN